jgi:hypothetical protein
MTDVRTVVDWMADGARSAAKFEDFLVELSQRMIDSGIPIRDRCFVTLPGSGLRAFIWQTDGGEISKLDTTCWKRTNKQSCGVFQPSRWSAPTPPCPMFSWWLTFGGGRPTMQRFHYRSPATNPHRVMDNPAEWLHATVTDLDMIVAR